MRADLPPTSRGQVTLFISCRTAALFRWLSLHPALQSSLFQPDCQFSHSYLLKGKLDSITHCLHFTVASHCPYMKIMLINLNLESSLNTNVHVTSQPLLYIPDTWPCLSFYSFLVLSFKVLNVFSSVRTTFISQICVFNFSPSFRF